jgi:hypothetical protein
VIFCFALRDACWSLEFRGGLKSEEGVLSYLCSGVYVGVSVCNDGLALSERETDVLSLVVVCVLIDHRVGPASKLTRMQTLFTLSVRNLTSVAVECVVVFVLARQLVGDISILNCIFCASGRCFFEAGVVNGLFVLDLQALVSVKLAWPTKFVCCIQIRLLRAFDN